MKTNIFSCSSFKSSGPFGSSLFACRPGDRDSTELNTAPFFQPRQQQRSPARRSAYLAPFERSMDLWSPAADIFDVFDSMIAPMAKIPTGQR